MDKKYTMHLIINTHWDREYRWSFPETQLRLVEALDILIDTMEKDPRFYSFHTDSQASMIDDYLALRPEKRGTVEKLIHEGRLQVGPWYTLPAEFLVSGEALTRNLLLGHRIARELGGVMKVGYNIFSWGQVSQLPQLYSQFGIDTILFYRGIDQSSLKSLEFWWDAPNGTRTLGITFGAFHRLNFWVYVYKPYIFGIKPGTNPEGFKRTGKDGVMTNLCDTYSDDINHHILNQPNHADEESALKGMENLMNTLTDKSSTSHLLFLQGFDQECPDPVVPDLVELINKKIDYGKIVISTLPEYIKSVKQELEEKKITEKLPVLAQEMLSVEKQGDPFGPLYPGVFSARMPIKLRNHDCEVRLEKWAEPASVWALMFGSSYPQTPLQAAWKELLQNQQHDGIGGCHVDRVTTAMFERYANVRDVAETITRNALHSIVSKIDFSDLKESDIGIVVFNPHPYPVSTVLEAVVDIPVEFDPEQHGKYFRDSSLDVFDHEGNKQSTQVLRQEKETVYAYLKYGSHTSFDATRTTIAFEANNIPPLGFRKFKASPKSEIERPLKTLVPAPHHMENEYLSVLIHDDGRISLTHKKTGKTFKNLSYFEDEGEQGGPLKFIPPQNEGAYSTKGHPADIVLLQNGPLLARYRIEHEWLLPAELESEIKIHVPHGMQWIDHGPLKRSSLRKTLKISTEITLRKGSPYLEFRTVVDNTIKDHRLRVVFPTNLKAEHVWADSPYDIVKRTIQRPESEGWYEEPLRTYPSYSLIDVSDGNMGIALLHYGITEYEVSDDKRQAIYLTLLRAFRTAGNPSETHQQQPLAQCPGQHEFRYALYPHTGDWQEGRVEKQTLLFNVPMRIAQCSAHSGTLKQSRYSFLEITPETLVMTALKKAEEKDAVLIRLFNPSDDTVSAKLRFPVQIKHADQVTLEELVIKQLEVNSNKQAVEFDVGPKEIVSIMVTFDREL